MATIFHWPRQESDPQLLSDAMPLVEAIAGLGAAMRREEFDSEVFGDGLDQPPYAIVEPIAAISAVIRAGQE